MSGININDITNLFNKGPVQSQEDNSTVKNPLLEGTTNLTESLLNNPESSNLYNEDYSSYSFCFEDIEAKVEIGNLISESDIEKFRRINMLNYSKYIHEVAAVQVGVINHGKKAIRIECPEGFTLKGKICTKMTPAEQKMYTKRAIKAAKTRSKHPNNAANKSREKSMLTRSKMPVSQTVKRPAVF